MRLTLLAMMGVGIVSGWPSWILGAEARVRAPTTAPARSYILLDGSLSVASQRLTWHLLDADVPVFRSGDGRQILINVPSPRTLCLTLEATDTDRSTDIQQVCLQITAGVEPGPTPRPVIPPSPAPLPDLPAGRFGLARPARDQARKLTHATRDEELPRVIAQLQRLRVRIQSGEVDVVSLSSLKEGLDKLQRENKAALGESIRLWSPWGNWWATAMKELYLAHKLAAPSDWIAAIDETIQGLQAVLAS